MIDSKKRNALGLAALAVTAVASDRLRQEGRARGRSRGTGTGGLGAPRPSR